MNRVTIVLTLALLLAAATHWTSASQGDDAPRFTGTSSAMDGKDLLVARRHFDPGARTYWHSHDTGQLLMVEQGRMRLQKRGQAMKELGAGESDYTAPNVAHWHGATPSQPLVQINVGFGGGAKWMEAVSDAQYAGKP